MAVNNPLVTVLSFSGGKQSSALLWLILLGRIPKPDNFLILNANPGMENSLTYKYIDMMRKETRNRIGQEIITVEGGNLFEDIVTLNQTTKKRLDNPPYWTKSKEGKKGRLRQSCTQKYKIQPMDSYLRLYLSQNFGIPITRKRIGNNIVEKWIGFSMDEVVRVKPSTKKYSYFRYPLIEMKLKKKDILQFFTENNLPIPPRSVCNACFANGLSTLQEMYLTRPDDWEQAVLVDKSVRDWAQIGVRDEIYVSNTLIPLDQLPKRGFMLEEDLENDYSCDSGFCFI